MVSLQLLLIPAYPGCFEAAQERGPRDWGPNLVVIAAEDHANTMLGGDGKAHACSLANKP